MDVGQDHELPRLEDERSAFEAMQARLGAERAERLATEVDPHAVEVAALRQAHSAAELWALSRQDDGQAALAKEALVQQLVAIDARARLDPDPALVARLGARPEPGPVREAWDQAVGQVAAYRGLWGGGAIEDGPGASWALGPCPNEAAAATHWRHTADTLHEAEVALAASLSTAELANERRRLEVTLAPVLNEGFRDTAASMAVFASERLRESKRYHEEAEQQLAELEAAGRARRHREALEQARRSVAFTGQRMAVDAGELERAQTRVKELDDAAALARPMEERLAVLEEALKVQIHRVVAQSPPYLSELLGPRPERGPERTRWEQGAFELESYRHRELGMSPAEGLFPEEDEVAQVLGPRPESYMDSLRWEAAVTRALTDHELAVELEGPSIELDLGL